VVVVDDARAMTLGTGDDVAVLILDPALAMALRTNFHAACLVPSRQHRIFETPVPHRQLRLASAPPPRKLSSSFESHRSGRTGSFSRIARHVDQRRVSAGVVCTPSSRMLPSVIAGRVVLGVHSMTSSARSRSSLTLAYRRCVTNGSGPYLPSLVSFGEMKWPRYRSSTRSVSR
jgi:hypothetical protein